MCFWNSNGNLVIIDLKQKYVRQIKDVYINYVFTERLLYIFIIKFYIKIKNKLFL